MTVSELIKELQKEDPDRVVCQKDSEGNGYSPLSGTYTGAYLPYNSWCGEVGLESLTPELKAQGYSEEDIKEDGINALILFPTN